MSLMVPRGPSWSNCTSNLTGTPSLTVFGTAVTAGANDTPSTAVALLTNLSHDVELLVLGFSGFFLATNNGSCMVNILVDPAGASSWSSTDLITGLICGQTVAATTAVPVPLWYHFPLWIKAGSSIGVEAQTAHTADITTGQVICHAYGGNKNPASWWCGKTVDGIAIDTANTQGTNHSAGNATFSSWTNFGSTLSAPCGALQFVVEGSNTDTNQLARTYFYEFGVNSTRIGPPILKTGTAAESGYCVPGGPLFCALPAGTQFMVRGICSSNVDALDVAAYAVI